MDAQQTGKKPSNRIVEFARRYSTIPIATYVGIISVQIFIADDSRFWSISLSALLLTFIAFQATIDLARVKLKKTLDPTNIRQARVSGHVNDVDLDEVRREIEEEELEFAADMLLDDTTLAGHLDQEELIPAAARTAQGLTELFLMLGPPGDAFQNHAGDTGGPQGGVDVGPRG